MLVDVRFELADHRLAQQVGREREPPPPEADDRLDGFRRSGTGDEFSGHHAGRETGRAGEPSFAGRIGRGELDREAQPPGHAIAGFGQVLGEVAPDGLVGVQGRQSVDEPEELHAHQRVIERRGDEQVFPPGALPGPGPAAHAVEELAADFGCAAVAASPVRVGCSRPEAGCAGAQGQFGSGAAVRVGTGAVLRSSKRPAWIEIPVRDVTARKGISL